MTGTETTDNAEALDYGAKVIAIEPGGAEWIPPEARHGHPISLFWTWTSPNMEFATIFVGFLGVAAFGLNLWQAIVAIIIGNALGSITHGFLTARGPSMGVPQMVLGRLSFGYFGNAVPATLMSLMSGVGWFATNSVSATFALNTLTGLPKVPSLVIVVIAELALGFLGHNMIHAFERFAFPILAIIFVISAIVIFTKTDPSYRPSHHGGSAGFLLTIGAAFGYTAGWNPTATDYSRYLPTSVRGWVAGVYAGAGLFWSTTLLMIVGAASATIPYSGNGSPTDQFTSHFSTWLADLVLIAIVLGGVSANAVNVYSAAMSFSAVGFKTKMHIQRAASAVLFGVIGFLVAWWALKDAASSYENFLLIIAYWIGPWLGVVFVDQFLRRGHDVRPLLYDRSHANWWGLISFAIAVVGSILLFANQTEFHGYVAKHAPSVGDITFFVGFGIAAILYAIGFLATDKNAATTAQVAEEEVSTR